MNVNTLVTLQFLRLPGNDFRISSELWAPGTSSTDETRTILRLSFRRWKPESFRGNREDVQCAYLWCYICFCRQNTRHHPMVKWFVHFVEGNSTCTILYGSVGCAAQLHHLGSPAPQDLSKAFMAVTGGVICPPKAMNQQKVDAIESSENLQSDNPIGSNSLRSLVTCHVPSIWKLYSGHSLQAVQDSSFRLQFSRTEFPLG